MSPSDWPQEAQRIYRAVYQDEDAPIRDLPLVDGVSHSFFAELVVGCLYHYIHRARLYARHDMRNHQRLGDAAFLQELKVMAASGWRPAAELGARGLEAQREARAHHDEIVAYGKATGS